MIFPVGKVGNEIFANLAGHVSSCIGVKRLPILDLDLDYDPLWGSMIKQTIRRVYPGFNESYYGYRSFADLLKEAERQKLIDLEYDEGRGNYKVRLRSD